MTVKQLIELLNYMPKHEEIFVRDQNGDWLRFTLPIVQHDNGRVTINVVVN